MGVKYDSQHFNPRNLSPHNIDRQAVEEIPAGSFVLDIGCATGFMGRYLREKKNCIVVGLEMRGEEARKARKVLNEVIEGDVQDPLITRDVLAITQRRKFDIVLATSLIEHVVSPDNAVKVMMKLLKADGKLVVTTPNVAHWSMRLSLLRGKFDYSDYGILDNTHVHFFTIKTFRELFERNGLKVQKLQIDAEGGGFPRISLALAPFLPNVFAYQMLVVATR